MQPEAHAISLLSARASTIEEVLYEYQKTLKTAPKDNPNTRFLSAEQEFATKLSDMKREAIASIKRIEAKQKADAELCQAALRRVS